MFRDATAPITLSILLLTAVVEARSSSGASPDRPREHAHPLQFTVTTTIRGEKNGVPLAIHRTLFRDGRVYDLTEAPGDQRRFVTVFDFPGEQVLLLDQETRVRTSLAIQTLAEATARARVAAEQTAGERSLGLDAEVSVHDDKAVYAVAFDRLSYQTSVQTPRDPRIVAAFAQFTDWAARLNVAQKVPAPPPFARMKLNQRIAADGRMPKQLVFSVDRAPASTRWYVDHELTESIDDVDSAKLDALEIKAEGYSVVGWEAFPR